MTSQDFCRIDSDYSKDSCSRSNANWVMSLDYILVSLLIDLSAVLLLYNACSPQHRPVPNTPLKYQSCIPKTHANAKRMWPQLYNPNT